MREGERGDKDSAYAYVYIRIMCVYVCVCVYICTHASGGPRSVTVNFDRARGDVRG